MSHDTKSDLVIRSRLTPSGTEFVVLRDASAMVVGGPFTAMTDAVAFAVASVTTARGRILYEAHDERGRLIGERLQLRTAHT
jgi:hypothetical protein